MIIKSIVLAALISTSAMAQSVNIPMLNAIHYASEHFKTAKHIALFYHPELFSCGYAKVQVTMADESTVYLACDADRPGECGLLDEFVCPEGAY